MSHALLAFDTSTEAMAVALHARGTTQAWNGPGGALASAQLLPRVAAMLASSGLVPRDLAAIAFGRGPGAFTGLRTAAAAAQGLAFGLGLPVLPVDSLLIVAEDALPLAERAAQAGDIGVVMDARMGELYAARYRWQHGDWHMTMAPALCTPEALREAWRLHAPAQLAGNGVHMLTLPDSGAQQATAQEPMPLRDRAAALLRLAQRMQARAEGVDASLALPMYLRDKVALTTQERVQAAAR